ncbi:RT0821/Lpp0805 family surface protein [Alsobacter soli]|nr:RT0821/Lpp0805 family surface protein [Alsobacter soli]
MLSAGLCGCSMVLPGMSVVDPDVTGSLPPPANSPLAPAIDDVDWKVASPALALSLDPLHKGPSASWKNADTGSSGAFAPNGPAYLRNDQVCRSFTATVRVQGRDEKLVGAACRVGAGDWTVQKVKPFAEAI